MSIESVEMLFKMYKPGEEFRDEVSTWREHGFFDGSDNNEMLISEILAAGKRGLQDLNKKVTKGPKAGIRVPMHKVVEEMREKGQIDIGGVALSLAIGQTYEVLEKSTFTPANLVRDLNAATNGTSYPLMCFPYLLGGHVELVGQDKIRGMTALFEKDSTRADLFKPENEGLLPSGMLQVLTAAQVLKPMRATLNQYQRLANYLNREFPDYSPMGSGNPLPENFIFRRSRPNQ